MFPGNETVRGLITLSHLVGFRVANQPTSQSLLRQQDVSIVNVVAPTADRDADLFKSQAILKW